MLRYLTMAVVLVAWAGTGCSDKVEPRKPAGDKTAVDQTQAPQDMSTARREDKSKAASPGPSSGGADTSTAQPGPDTAAGDGGGTTSGGPAAAPLDPAVMATVQPLLVQMASDASIERQAAAESLDEMGATATQYITAALGTGTDAEKRGAAAYLIGRVSLQDDATLEVLIGALGAPDDVLRHNALQAIEKLSDKQLRRALTALAEFAKNAKEETAYRVRAVRAMAKLGAAGREKAPDLFQMARDEATPELQRSAIDAIGKVAAPEEAEAFFLELLKNSPQKDIRRLAATRLIQAVQSPQAVVGLIAAFSDAEAEVRNATINALVAIGRPAVPELIKALDDPNVQVRRRAVLTLGKLNTLAVAAVPDLQKKLQDADPEVRGLAAASLKIIQGR